jgi:hypothetical protein
VDTGGSASVGGDGANSADGSAGTAQVGGGNSADWTLGTAQVGPASSAGTADPGTADPVDAPTSVGSGGGNDAGSSVGTTQIGGGNGTSSSVGTGQVGSLEAASMSIGGGENTADTSFGTLQVGGGNTAGDSEGTLQFFGAPGASGFERLDGGSPSASGSTIGTGEREVVAAGLPRSPEVATRVIPGSDTTPAGDALNEDEALQRTARAGTLPFTGLSILGATLLGLLLAAAGLALRSTSRSC